MIIITGSSRGIGRYLFKKFWETGTTAYGTFNKTFPDSDKEKYLMKVDISNYSDVKNWIESIRNKIDALKKEIAQYENNISFFGSGKSTELLLEQAQKKINT